MGHPPTHRPGLAERAGAKLRRPPERCAPSAPRAPSATGPTSPRPGRLASSRAERGGRRRAGRAAAAGAVQQALDDAERALARLGRPACRAAPGRRLAAARRGARRRESRGSASRTARRCETVATAPSQPPSRPSGDEQAGCATARSRRRGRTGPADRGTGPDRRRARRRAAGIRGPHRPTAPTGPARRCGGWSASPTTCQPTGPPASRPRCRPPDCSTPGSTRPRVHAVAAVRRLPDAAAASARPAGDAGGRAGGRGRTPVPRDRVAAVLASIALRQAEPVRPTSRRDRRPTAVTRHGVTRRACTASRDDAEYIGATARARRRAARIAEWTRRSPRCDGGHRRGRDRRPTGLADTARRGAPRRRSRAAAPRGRSPRPARSRAPAGALRARARPRSRPQRELDQAVADLAPVTEVRCGAPRSRTAPTWTGPRPLDGAVAHGSRAAAS